MERGDEKMKKSVGVRWHRTRFFIIEKSYNKP